MPQAEPAAALVDRVLAANTPAERDAILDGNRAAVTLELHRALIARARADDRNYPRAVVDYAAAVAVAERLHANAETAVSYRGLGLAHYRQGHFQEALDFYRRGVAAAEAAGDKGTLAELLRGIGLAEAKVGHREAAMEATERSLELARQLGDLRSVSGVLSNLSALYGDAGNWKRRLELLQESLTVAETNHLDDRIRFVYDNLSVAYFESGDYEIGLSYLEKGLQMAVAAHDAPRDISGTLNNLAMVYQRLGRFDEAAGAFEQSLEFARSAQDEVRTAIELLNIGALHRMQGAYARARAELEESQAIQDRNHFEVGRAETRINLAYLSLAAGDAAAARATAQAAVDIARTARVQGTLTSALTALGDALLQSGDRAAARAAFTEAVSVVETERRTLSGGGAEGSAFLEEEISPYHGLIRVAIEDGRTVDALATAEQAKARQLFDLIHTNRVEITRAMTDAERAEEARLAAEVSRVDVALTRSSDAAEAGRLRTQLDAAVGGLEAFRASLYRRHPELQLQRGDLRPLSSTDLASLVPDPSTAMIEYVVADAATFAFEITRTDAGGAAVSAVRIPVGRAELEREVEAFRRQLASRDLDYRPAARAWYDRLIAPLISGGHDGPSLQGKTLVGIVPDGALWGLPFQALVAPSGAHLIEQLAVFYAPSLTTLAETLKLKRDRTGRATLLAMSAPSAAAMPVALPPLGEAAAETRQIAALYGRAASTVLTRADATEGRWKAEAGRYRVLHLATHGVLNGVNPLYSYLVLGKDAGDDGLLEAREILDLTLTADLAVLSACDTARGRFHYGEGTIGLSWAFLVAGTPATVVSHWSVEGTSTSRLMVDFHRRLLATGGPTLRGKARALQRAAIALMRQSAYRPPFYWAAFAVIGDGY